ncbi:hypothetical protein QBC37DRAFT_407072 [Rhypophila decipiens]|uniref:Uncharacterized protein n=1 Tax=Rhypophila decipiens TaxID=261697 RepID=A0AAN6XTU0_9PEZI|nr:hypothetical protein QBC37DRAFT_407072 [Rhypophila decipiens]
MAPSHKIAQVAPPSTVSTSSAPTSKPQTDRPTAPQAHATSERIRALETQLVTAKNDAERLRNMWKEATSQLNRARMQNFYQVSDEILEQRTRRLRYNIHAWAVNYYERVPLERKRQGNPYGKRHGSSEPVLEYKKHMDKAIARSSNLSGLLAPSLMELILWRVIVREIFNHYRWAPDDYGNPVFDLRWAWSVKPGPVRSPHAESPDPDAVREVQLWNAATTNLILKNATADPTGDIDQSILGISQRIRARTSDFRKHGDSAPHDGTLEFTPFSTKLWTY